MITRLVNKIKRVNRLKKQKHLQHKFLDEIKLLDPKKLIILDLGFNVGETFNLISGGVEFDMYYGFEMQRDLAYAKEFKGRQKLKLIHAAVIDSDSQTTSYFEPKTWSKTNIKAGSTIIQNKKNSSDVPIVTPAIRLSSWIETNIPDEMLLVLKIDIEGAEYQVIEELLQHDFKPKITLIAVEWHCTKFGIQNEAQYLARKNQIKISCWQRDIKIMDWF